MNHLALGISPLSQPESATAIEYGLIAALVAIGIIAGATAFGNLGKVATMDTPVTSAPATK